MVGQAFESRARLATMPYLFATERHDFSDLAGGAVLHAIPGQPALPVRLADEVFQRCLAARRGSGPADPLCLYDPCCGGGYQLTVLGLMHGREVNRIVGSDIQPALVRAARRNLDLVSREGLDRRIAELEQHARDYQRPSYALAAASARRLRDALARDLGDRILDTDVFEADALDPDRVAGRLGPASVDIALADVPYGRHSVWQGRELSEIADGDWIGRLLESLRGVLRPGGVVGIVSDKGQKALHPAYKRLERFQIGKRRVAILRLGE